MDAQQERWTRIEVLQSFLGTSFDYIFFIVVSLSKMSDAKRISSIREMHCQNEFRNFL